MVWCFVVEKAEKEAKAGERGEKEFRFLVGEGKRIYEAREKDLWKI